MIIILRALWVDACLFGIRLGERGCDVEFQRLSSSPRYTYMINQSINQSIDQSIKQLLSIHTSNHQFNYLRCDDFL